MAAVVDIVVIPRPWDRNWRASNGTSPADSKALATQPKPAGYGTSAPSSGTSTRLKLLSGSTARQLSRPESKSTAQANHIAIEAVEPESAASPPSGSDHCPSVNVAELLRT